MNLIPKNKIPLEVTLTLDKFKARDYQKDFIYNFETKQYSKFMLVWPRRAGKDLLSFQLCLREALKYMGSYYIVYPTYSQGKKIMFQSVTAGDAETPRQRYIDFMPKEVVKSLNKQEMRWELYNGSIIQCVGSKDVDRLVGVSIQGAIFSEYAKQSPEVYKYLRPAIMESKGWSIFISTPRGRNHFYDLYNISKDSKDWYSQHYNVEQTGHIPIETIETDIANGEYSQDHALQEFWCRFDAGIEGTYYGKYLDRMRKDGCITDIPHEPSYPVHTAWDLGYKDPTSIIFFQKIGDSIRIIRTYENTEEYIEHYLSYLNKLKDTHGYIFGKHLVPHDIAVHEYGGGMTRAEKASRLGFHLTPVTKFGDKRFGLKEGIDNVRTLLSRVRIDEVNAEGLVRALENYRKQWSEKLQEYTDSPRHDKYSHMADAMRYLAAGMNRLNENVKKEDLEESFLKHKYNMNDKSGFFNSFNKRK